MIINKNIIIDGKYEGWEEGWEEGERESESEKITTESE